MTAPVFVDDRLITNWMAALNRRRSTAFVPSTLIESWQLTLLAAVQEAREPVPLRVTGRFAALDRYLTGIAAGLAAGLATSPASDAGDSDPIILAAGLLAGSAALLAATEVEDYEVAAARAAAAAVVDSAANGAGLVVVIQAATRAAVQVRSRTLIGLALEALLFSVTPHAVETDPQGRYEIRLLLEPVDPRNDLNEVAIDRVLREISEERQWYPDETGYRMTLVTAEPGALIETIWGFGRVRNLQIRFLPD